MERIVNYNEIPFSRGKSIYFRMETDPKLYFTLMYKGYHIVNNIQDADQSTIYLTGRRQDYLTSNTEEYKLKVTEDMLLSLKKKGITKPKTECFSFDKLFAHQYELPFVLKNENQNGGREKFLIQTEVDYENLVKSCLYLLDREVMFLGYLKSGDSRYQVDYSKYLESNFSVQEYIHTPSEYNTTVRIITTPSYDLLYGSLKYNQVEEYNDCTSMLGMLLHDLYPLSTKSIVSNTLSGGENILLGEDRYTEEERRLLDLHKIDSPAFQNLVQASEDIHHEFHSELGIICGFDYIYDEAKDKWHILEFHSRPMVGDYSRRQGIPYNTHEERLIAEGRVRATAFNKVLQKTR